MSKAGCRIMEDVADAEVVRTLVGQATTHVGRVSGREPWRAALMWATRGRLGRRSGHPVVLVVGTPWQDTPSANRPGWRERAAYLDGEEVFAVDYQVCRRCRLGWVEEPATDGRYRRHGLAQAGLAALRGEFPGVEWHTLGGHFRDSQPFWTTIGAGVPGGYQQRAPCPHLR